MNRKFAAIPLGALLVIGLLALKNWSRSEPASPEIAIEKPAPQIGPPPTLTGPNPTNIGIDFNQRPPEIRSLHMMTNLLARALQPGINTDQIAALLRDQKQEPLVTRESNPDTGTLTVIRTNKPFPGTRNFHAQYFGDENGQNTFVQNMSFELRPIPTALEDAKEAVRIHFPGVEQPTQTESGSHRYLLPNDYVVMVKQLTKEDIEEPNPFQAYASEDIGTVRVSLEIDESHDDEEDEGYGEIEEEP